MDIQEKNNDLPATQHYFLKKHVGSQCNIPIKMCVYIHTYIDNLELCY